MSSSDVGKGLVSLEFALARLHHKAGAEVAKDRFGLDLHSTNAIHESGQTVKVNHRYVVDTDPQGMAQSFTHCGDSVAKEQPQAAFASSGSNHQEISGNPEGLNRAFGVDSEEQNDVATLPRHLLGAAEFLVAFFRSELATVGADQHPDSASRSRPW